MFEQYFKTNEEVGALYSVEDLLKVSLINDDLSSFIHNWESVIAGISHVPEELTLRDILLRQIRGCHKLKYDLDTYDRAKEGTETHTYQFLLSSIKNLLTRERVRKNRDRIAKAVPQLQRKARAKEKVVGKVESHPAWIQSGSQRVLLRMGKDRQL